ncbi:MAG: type II toxin-antitoxin system PemK/MazF family toxin [Acidobacteriaceae bacterium]|nr:type II toxin-antitoxin system PemK/MazF family toxin [Acidobacteriaceae bacterium]
MSRRWVPELGDFLQLDFDPSAGHEQAGRRPAMVLSESAYNGTGMALVCPVTNQVKGYPFEVSMPAGLPVTGVILSDQIRCIDLKQRNAKSLGAAAPRAVLEAVQLRLRLLLNLK